MSVELSAAPPRRIPKLKVRNRIDDVEPPTHLRGLNLDAIPITPSSTRDAQSPVNDDDEITPIASRVPTQVRKPSRPDLDSRISNRSDVSDDAQDPARPGSAYTYYSQGQSVDLGRGSNFSPSLAPSSNKKKSRLWGSLMLKEPSTNAWKDFAELQKQEQALKGAQSKPLLDKKLPEHIPKVNSKWNGLPDHAQPPKGKPWKSSLDISRSSHSRASGYSNVTKDPGASRPGSGHSGRSSNSSTKTAKRVTSKHSDTPSGGSSKSTKTTGSKRTTTADRIGPAMSTDSIEPSSPLREPSSIPASSLFFPAEPTPPTYTPRTNLAPTTPIASLVPTTSAAPSPPTSLFDSPKIPQGPRTSPAAASRDDLTVDVVSHDSPLSDEESTPTQERANLMDTVPVSSPNTTALSPQTSPTLIVDSSSFLGSPSLGGPHNFHNRFKKQYKSVDEIPQWPLPTKPEDVVIEPEPDLLTPTVPHKSHKRLSSNSSVDSPTQPSFFFSQTDGTSSRTSSEDSSPVSPIPPSSVVHPLGINMYHTKYPPPSAPTSPSNTRLAPLIAPAFQPGRVKSRPFDLDTIAESDAGSIRAPSLYLSPNRSVVSVINEPQQQSTPTGIPRVSLAASRASSEMSEQWHMSPEERTGLGPKFKAKAAPWQVPGSAIRSDGTWNVEEDGEQRKKGGLIGRFRR